MPRCWPVVALVAFGAACSSPEPREPGAGSEPAPPAGAPASDIAPPFPQAADEGPLSLAASLDRFRLDRPLWGDLDAIAERRVLRVAVAYNKTNYFLDGPQQRGATYELLREFDKALNAELGTGDLKVQVVIVPMTRDRLLPALQEGMADIAAGTLTATPERRRLVDFSAPLYEGVREIVVTGPQGPALAELEDLARREIWVRPSSSYHASLVALNADFERRGLAPVVIRDAEELLEDEDLLEMVAAGLLGATVVDHFMAEFWAQIFDGLVLHQDLTVRTGGEIAWALRKETPELARFVDEFVATHKVGTLLGNILVKRYFKDTEFAKNALAADDVGRFRSMVELFQRYAGEYDFDWLMLAAQGYQESGLDQSVRSAAGAIGVMQLLKSTAGDPAVGIPNIEETEANIHAGAKYLRILANQYFADLADDPFNQQLFVFAGYNAGPNRIARLRAKAAERGLDPDVWFRQVEVLAAEQIGRETVQYVSNIYKYYVAYRLVADRLEAERAAV